MPGPPPAGVSSTVRCLSVAALRLSWVSSDQMADWESQIADGDEVLFFPPVAGG